MHPLWSLCLLVRVILISLTLYTGHLSTTWRIVLGSSLGAMGVGFLYKSVTGSNNEVQVEKVFWHDSRAVHGVLFGLSAMYTFRDQPRLAGWVLTVDVVASVMYRILLCR